MFVLNHGKTTEKTTIRLKVKEKGDYVLQEIYQKKAIKLTPKDGAIEFNSGDIPEKEAEIWIIKKATK
jgi:hypothetical protein